MQKQKTLMNNLTGTYQRCREENIGISLNHLTYLVKSGTIPSCKIGTKYLINWNILMDYLNGKLKSDPDNSIDDSTPAVNNPVPLNKDNPSLRLIKRIR